MLVPTVDLEPFRTASTLDPARRDVVDTLAAACADAGFFQVIGHGGDPAVASELERSSRQFFALGDAAKAEIAMTRGGRAWRGWFPLGAELTSGVADNKEGVYFGCDLPTDDPRVRRGLPLHGPNLYPAEPPGMGALVDEWMEQATEVGRWVLRALALGLGLPERWFERWCADPVVLFRIFHYPAVPAGSEGWGVAEHTDYGLLTLLAQDHTGGLEVRGPDGWTDVAPTPGALVCNLGDMLERATGGRFRSTPHRVRNTDDDRISMPLFLDPGWDAVVEPIPGHEPAAATLAGAGERRWDGASVFDGATRYGDYLGAKVSRVFPELFGRLVEGEP